MTKEELRKLRREKEMTQKQLSEKAGISLPTCNRAEKSGKVRLETMQKLFQVLNSNN
jgi:predicted transcriptional regulator